KQLAREHNPRENYTAALEMTYNPLDQVFPGLDPGIATNAGICGDPRVKPEDDGATIRIDWEGRRQRPPASDR
ncbi:MAG: hypothetical protein QOG25_1736, partial [Acetobacteraceae bacterium]|nr:hypothetical protein [Acetobacteraceae bacterium]